MLQHQPHGPFPDFRGITFVSVHCSILSRNGVSGKPGAVQTGLAPGEFVHTLGDAHLYLNHRKQADLQLEREPLPPPQMKINPDVNGIFDFRYEDFELVDYQAHPSIPAPIAV